MKIAVEGCCHGELEKIYDTLAYIEQREKIKVDLLICCGDFQAVRNQDDLETMAVPPKYRQMQSFHKYYSGEKKAPVLTLFVGGNHEASNHLWELPFGGWVAPNIYYMGIAGVVNIGGYRIAGMSGIYKEHDYHKGHFEYPPFDESTKRSIYHVRKYDVFKMKLMSNPVDIFISHDWPKGIYNYGNVGQLLSVKKYFREEIEANTLGNQAHEELLRWIKPTYWFAGHLHVKFTAIVPHRENDKIIGYTKFLALDKCLPRRDFLQIIDVETRETPLKLTYDVEWLGITKRTRDIWSFTARSPWLPENTDDAVKFKPTQDDLNLIREKFGESLAVPDNFQQTAPLNGTRKSKKNVIFNHPQTEEFCQKLNIGNPCIEYARIHGKICSTKSYIGKFKEKNPESSTDATSTDESETYSDSDFHDLRNPMKNPDEISLDSDSDGDDDEEAEDEEEEKEANSKDSNNREHSPHSDKRALSDTETKESLSEPRSVDTTKRPFKMVRRNVAIYTSTEDDSDDL